MAEHVLPLAFDLVAKRRGADGLDGGDVDSGVGAFASQDGAHPGYPDDVRVAVHVDHVVEVVPRSAALSERAQLLTEELGERVAKHSFEQDRATRMIAIP